MIKINLLNSVTERQAGTVVAVDRKIRSGASRLVLMAVVVMVLTSAVIGWEIISTQMAHTAAQQKLDEQKRIAAELETVMNEQKDLEAKIQSIDGRIEAIKKLRASQAGPSAVLEAMRERISMVPGLYLESVEQTDGQLTFKGNSPDESQVTQFGQSLEFSNGLFTNLNIETNRAEVQNNSAVAKPGAEGVPKVEIVNFTIKCGYSPTKAPGSSSGSPTTAAVTPPVANPAQPQVAKN